MDVRRIKMPQKVVSAAAVCWLLFAGGAGD
jgi:hypothetical protein